MSGFAKGQTFFWICLVSLTCSGQTAVAQPDTDCVAVVIDRSGVFVAARDGTPVPASPTVNNFDIQLAALSPDRRLLGYFTQAQNGLLSIASASGAIKTMAIPADKSTDYPISAIRWDSDSMVRLAREGHNASEFQFLKLSGWPQSPSLVDATTPLLGSDCIYLENTIGGVCAAGEGVEIEGIWHTLEGPRSLPKAVRHPVVEIGLGATSQLLTDAGLSAQFSSFDSSDQTAQIRFFNPGFGFIEARMIVGRDIDIIANERIFRVILSAIKNQSITLTIYEAEPTAGFLSVDHITTADLAFNRYLIYTLRDTHGTQFISTGGKFASANTINWNITHLQTRLPRTSPVLSIRSIGSGSRLQVDDTEGSYTVPITMKVVSVPAYKNGDITVPATTMELLTVGSLTALPRTLPARQSTDPPASVLSWSCR